MKRSLTRRLESLEEDFGAPAEPEVLRIHVTVVGEPDWFIEVPLQTPGKRK